MVLKGWVEGRRGFVGNGAERRFVGGGARRRSDEGVEGSWAKKVPGEVAKAVECLTWGKRGRGGGPVCGQRAAVPMVEGGGGWIKQRSPVGAIYRRRERV